MARWARRQARFYGTWGPSQKTKEETKGDEFGAGLDIGHVRPLPAEVFQMLRRDLMMPLRLPHAHLMRYFTRLLKDYDGRIQTHPDMQAYRLLPGSLLWQLSTWSRSRLYALALTIDRLGPANLGFQPLDVWDLITGTK